MTFYIIKTHYIPTERTKESDPKVFEHDYFTGKAGFNMNTESWFGNMKDNKLWDCPYSLEHAYKRKCDAVRALKFKKESDDWETKAGHWIVSSEIITVEG